LRVSGRLVVVSQPVLRALLAAAQPGQAAHQAAGEAESAAAALHEALELWRGPALADLTAGFDRLAAEAAVLEEQRLAVLEDRGRRDGRGRQDRARSALGA
jgi:Bacterial transcriptional activator domain